MTTGFTRVARPCGSRNISETTSLSLSSLSFFVIMTSLQQSEAHFKSRAIYHGLTDDHVAALKANRVSTISSYANSSSFVPGAADAGPFENVVKTVVGAENFTDIPLGIQAAFRALHFESYTVVAAGLRDLVERSDDQAPRRTPQAERNTRLAEQKIRLSGIDISNDLEPSYRLCDITNSMLEDNHVTWVAWDRCTRRDVELEMLGQKTPTMELSLGQDGRIRGGSNVVQSSADLTTPLKVKSALTRRGLAFDQTGLISFSVHSSWVEKLFRVFQADAPPGFICPNLEQLRLADRELFTQLNRASIGRVRPDAAGVRPLDELMKTMAGNSEVVYFLLPLAAGKKSLASIVHNIANEQDDDEESDRVKRVRGLGGKPKGKSKAKALPAAAAAGGGPPVGAPTSTPPWMKGRDMTRASDGKPYCFNYNRGRCEETTTDGCCRRGVHEVSPFSGGGKKRQR